MRFAGDLEGVTFFMLLVSSNVWASVLGNREVWFAKPHRRGGILLVYD